MSQYYDIAIRVDTSDSVELLRFLSADGGAYLVVRELEDSNPHFHVVLHSKRKHTAVRAALKRAMPGLNGNGSYSCTPVRDLAKYQRYMMKGEADEKMPEVVGAFGLNYSDPAWQEEMHEAYWHENELIRQSRKRAPVQEIVLQIVKEAKLSWSDREGIAKVYIRELAARDKPINLFAVKNSVNLIQIRLCPDDSALEDLAAKCV